MEPEYKSIREYMRSCDFWTDLPNIKISLFEGVYPPKLDSFLLAEELMKTITKSHKVLDIGAGSGILAILAAKTGAFTVATDVHEGSVKCARYNASLNNAELDARIGNLFDPLSEGELFDVIVSNPTSLPTPPNERHNEYTVRNIDAGPDGRKYLDLLITQAPKYLKEGGYFLTLHSNFANIERTKDRLEGLGFEVELKEYEYPIGKTSRQRIDYFLKHLPESCHPFKKGGDWYRRIGVFKAKRRGKWH